MRIWPVPTIDLMPFSTIEEDMDVALVFSGPAFNAVESLLPPLTITSRIEPLEATIADWNTLVDLVQGEVIYAVGGGLATDAAKYLAARSGLPLVCLPTALSVDAFFTWASGFRRDGCVRYIETKPPDRVIVDFDVLAQAPPPLRAAGICDVLSIATGSWDWRFAEEEGRNPAGMSFIPWVYDAAQVLLNAALDCAEAAGHGDREGLKQLLDCLVLEVQLCNQIGHSRPEEGSEHYFAYSVENVMGKGLPHGDLVGPGIVCMAEHQGQNTQRVRQALLACHARLDGIPSDLLQRTLRELPAYAEQHGLPFGIAHTL